VPGQLTTTVELMTDVEVVSALAWTLEARPALLGAA
jgi:hypothetical protein